MTLPLVDAIARAEMLAALDIARDQYLSDRTPESLSVVERETIREVTRKLALLRSIRALKQAAK